MSSVNNVMLPHSIFLLFWVAGGYAYPAYLSFKVWRKGGLLESYFVAQRDGQRFEDDTVDEKISYEPIPCWIVLSTIHMIHQLTNQFLSWLPLYVEFKLLLLWWTVSPNTQGYRVIFENAILPWLLRYENDIDCQMEQCAKAIRHGSMEIAQRILTSLYTIFMMTLRKSPDLLLELLSHGHVSDDSPKKSLKSVLSWPFTPQRSPSSSQKKEGIFRHSRENDRENDQNIDNCPMIVEQSTETNSGSGRGCDLSGQTHHSSWNIHPAPAKQPSVGGRLQHTIAYHLSPSILHEKLAERFSENSVDSPRSSRQVNGSHSPEGTATMSPIQRLLQWRPHFDKSKVK